MTKAPDSIRYIIEKNGGCCSRVTLKALVVKDGKGSFRAISEHNTMAAAEKKKARLEKTP